MITKHMITVFDPNNKLQRVLQLAEFIQKSDINDNIVDYANELAVHIKDLHFYLCNGGDLPVPWRKNANLE